MQNTNLFEEQFAKKENLQTPFGEVETVDITPQKLKHKTAILLASGWGEALELQKICLKEIYLSGRRVIALHHAPIILQREKENYPIAELQKAETLLLLLEHKHINTIDVVSHSEGAINVSIAATMQPKLFRNLILVTPAGVSGKDNGMRIIIGFIRHIFKMRTKASNQMQLAKNIKIYIHKIVNIAMRLSSFKKEISAMSSFDIHPLFINLQKQGIKIAILAGETDTAFPLDKVKKHLEKRNYLGVNIFETKKGGHELYSTNTPEIMQQVLGLLDKLTVNI